MFGHLRPKPDARMLRRWRRACACRPRAACWWKTRWQHQKAARRVGMGTVWMQRWMRAAAKPGARFFDAAALRRPESAATASAAAPVLGPPGNDFVIPAPQGSSKVAEPHWLEPAECEDRPTGAAAMTDNPSDRWKHDGVRVVPGDQLDANTAQTPGMDRTAAINFARVGAQKLWAGTVHIHPNAKTGAHHHGPLESVIYVVRGRARMRWGERLEFTAEAGPGDFIYVPPLRAAPGDQRQRRPRRWSACWCAATARRWPSTSTSSRSRSPRTVLWIDPTHPAGLSTCQGTAKTAKVSVYLHPRPVWPMQNALDPPTAEHADAMSDTPHSPGDADARPTRFRTRRTRRISPTCSTTPRPRPNRRSGCAGAQAPQARRAPGADPADAGRPCSSSPAPSASPPPRWPRGCEVSEAALYRHFASKAQMFEGLIEFIESSVFTLVNQIVERETGGADAGAAHRHRAAAVRREEPGHDARDGGRCAGVRARAADRAHEPVLRPRRVAAAPEPARWRPRPRARPRPRSTPRRWPRR